MKIDTEILFRGQEVIPNEEIFEITETVKRYYSFSTPNFWMWKMFQIGYVYGKRAERARKKGGAKA